jgi:hypothetical protein
MGPAAGVLPRDTVHLTLAYEAQYRRLDGGYTGTIRSRSQGAFARALHEHSICKGPTLGMTAREIRIGGMDRFF